VTLKVWHDEGQHVIEYPPHEIELKFDKDYRNVLGDNIEEKLNEFVVLATKFYGAEKL